MLDAFKHQAQSIKVSSIKQVSFKDSLLGLFCLGQYFVYLPSVIKDWAWQFGNKQPTITYEQDGQRMQIGLDLQKCFKFSWVGHPSQNILLSHFDLEEDCIRYLKGFNLSIIFTDTK